MDLIRVCAYCNKELGRKKVPRKEDGREITHGICPPCFEKAMGEVLPPQDQVENQAQSQT